ncbi:MAG: FKBP-type peptidyl-prolyl cis-trans isomerase [bacterium]
MPAVKKGDTVRINYKGTLADGSVFDDTSERGPLEMTVGDYRTLQRFEDAIIGMSPGDTKCIEIPMRYAYGPPRRNMERVLRKDVIPEGMRVQAGQRIRVSLEDGNDTIAKVINVRGGEVMIDANHPLAGQDLKFHIELVEIV